MGHHSPEDDQHEAYRYDPLLLMVLQPHCSGHAWGTSSAVSAPAGRCRSDCAAFPDGILKD